MPYCNPKTQKKTGIIIIPVFFCVLFKSLNLHCTEGRKLEVKDKIDRVTVHHEAVLMFGKRGFIGKTKIQSIKATVAGPQCNGYKISVGSPIV